MAPRCELSLRDLMKETRREEPTSLLIFDWKYFWRPGPKGTHGGPGPFLNWTGPAVAFLRTIGVFVLPMNHSRHRPPAPLPKVGTRCQSLFKMHEGVCWILGLCVAGCVSLSPLPPIFITSSVCVSLLRQQQKQQIPPVPLLRARIRPERRAPRGRPIF